MSDNDESLSYKFQRLREQIRAAIASGELSGKLPGERLLAKQFQVNAKTLSKALTDLAAEGLLDRSIGRGTYVKDAAAPAPAPVTGRWLVLADDDTSHGLIAALRAQNENLHVMSEPVDRIRPSFINQFSAVIDLAAATPESFLRDLVVRNIAVTAVGREPRTYSMNAVLIDAELGAARLTRDLLLAGHRRFVVAAERGHTSFVLGIRQTVLKFDLQGTVDVVYAAEVPSAIRAGATAVICDSAAAAEEAMNAMAKAACSAAVVAVGMSNGNSPCTGFFVSTAQIASAVADLLKPSQTSRPSVLWLAGERADRGTTEPVHPVSENAIAATQAYRSNDLPS